jgi:hypothetical protein
LDKDKQAERIKMAAWRERDAYKAEMITCSIQEKGRR